MISPNIASVVWLFVYCCGNDGSGILGHRGSTVSIMFPDVSFLLQFWFLRYGSLVRLPHPNADRPFLVVSGQT
ncbi:hypothetical protein DBV39_18455 [Orrella marina]|uniref:Uncharacterized protein n=1 Tax=Orrella marina TaxID=2163011 RepID=A0A2R4XNN5_9BURK|nr:hypothetical protein DBV39_18455 [Orrella marina]